MPELSKKLSIELEPELFSKKLRPSSKPIGFSTHLPNSDYEVINENTRFSRLAKAEMDVLVEALNGLKYVHNGHQMKGHVPDYCYWADWPLSGNLIIYF